MGGLFNEISAKVILARQLEINGPALLKHDDASNSQVLRVRLDILLIAQKGAGRYEKQTRER
jgi:hypothetical protein